MFVAVHVSFFFKRGTKLRKLKKISMIRGEGEEDDDDKEEKSQMVFCITGR